MTVSLLAAKYKGAAFVEIIKSQAVVFSQRDHARLDVRNGSFATGRM
jgi:hypothetical protein